MTRSVKDLRDMICISRLSSVEVVHNHDKLNEDKINGFRRNISDKLLTNNKSKSFHKKHNNLSEYERWYRIIDEDALKDLLERANKDLDWLSKWSENENVRVHFMYWWLTGVSSSDRKELINLEYEIACAEVLVTVKVHCTEAAVAENATKYLLSVVLWEYPDKLCGKEGPHVFLDYLDTLISRDCKRILSAVSVTTTDPHTIHYCLSVRAFVLLSLWSALVRFHEQLLRTSALSLTPLVSHSSPGDPFLSLLSIAISDGFCAVLQYWIEGGKIDVRTFSDNEGRNLITLAVSFKSLSVVKYLLANFDVSSIINNISKAGNSALHLAVCQGSLDLVKVLIEDGHADIEVVNPDCDDCTPLHMAAIYGQEDIAKYLVERGADSGAKTARENSTADMAAIFQETEMADLLSHMLHISDNTDMEHM